MASLSPAVYFSLFAHFPLKAPLMWGLLCCFQRSVRPQWVITQEPSPYTLCNPWVQHTLTTKNTWLALNDDCIRSTLMVKFPYEAIKHHSLRVVLWSFKFIWSVRDVMREKSWMKLVYVNPAGVYICVKCVQWTRETRHPSHVVSHPGRLTRGKSINCLEFKTKVTKAMTTGMSSILQGTEIRRSQLDSVYEHKPSVSVHIW